MKKMFSSSLRQTQQIAKSYSSQLHAGDVVLLQGDLGSGKTTFTQFLLAELGVKEVVNSPTFSILKIYSGKFTFYHFDCYRITYDEAIEAGFDEIFSKRDGIILVEWAENISPLIPAKHKIVEIHNLGGNSREFIFKG